MRTTVDIPDSLFRQAKATAAMRGIKLKELIQSFIEQGLGVDHDAQTAAHSPRIPLPTFRRTAPPPGPLASLTKDQITAIFDDEEARVYLAARKRLEEKGLGEGG